MDAILQVQTVIGDGPFSVIVEPRGQAVRLKRRGGGEVFIRFEDVPDLLRALSGFAQRVDAARA